jgi:hypothetical protein
VSAPDAFSVYLRGLAARDVEFRVIGDGRHILGITSDVSLYVRPAEDDIPAVIAGLRKLAGAAGEMARALGAEDAKNPDAVKLEEIRAVLEAFGGAHDRQWAIERIDGIVNGDRQ